MEFFNFSFIIGVILGYLTCIIFEIIEKKIFERKFK